MFNGEARLRNRRVPLTNETTKRKTKIVPQQQPTMRKEETRPVGKKERTPNKCPRISGQCTRWDPLGWGFCVPPNQPTRSIYVHCSRVITAGEGFVALEKYCFYEFDVLPREAGKKYEMADNITLPGGQPVPVVSDEESEKLEEQKAIRIKEHKKREPEFLSSCSTSECGLDSSFQSESADSSPGGQTSASISDHRSVERPESLTSTEEFEKERTSYLRPPPGLKFPANKTNKQSEFINNKQQQQQLSSAPPLPPCNSNNTNNHKQNPVGYHHASSPTEQQHNNNNNALLQNNNINEWGQQQNLNNETNKVNSPVCSRSWTEIANVDRNTIVEHTDEIKTDSNWVEWSDVVKPHSDYSNQNVWLENDNWGSSRSTSNTSEWANGSSTLDGRSRDGMSTTSTLNSMAPTTATTSSNLGPSGAVVTHHNRERERPSTGAINANVGIISPPTNSQNISKINNAQQNLAMNKTNQQMNPNKNLMQPSPHEHVRSSGHWSPVNPSSSRAIFPTNVPHMSISSLSPPHLPLNKQNAAVNKRDPATQISSPHEPNIKNEYCRLTKNKQMMIMSKKNNSGVLMQPILPSSPTTERSGTQIMAVGSTTSPLVQAPLSSSTGIFNHPHLPTANTNKILNKQMDAVPASSSSGHQHPPGSGSISVGSSNSGSNRHHVHPNHILNPTNKTIHGELNINENVATGTNRLSAIGNNENVEKSHCPPTFLNWSRPDSQWNVKQKTTDWNPNNNMASSNGNNNNASSDFENNNMNPNKQNIDGGGTTNIKNIIQAPPPPIQWTSGPQSPHSKKQQQKQRLPPPPHLLQNKNMMMQNQSSAHIVKNNRTMAEMNEMTHHAQQHKQINNMNTTNSNKIVQKQTNKVDSPQTTPWDFVEKTNVSDRRTGNIDMWQHTENQKNWELKNNENWKIVQNNEQTKNKQKWAAQSPDIPPWPPMMMNSQNEEQQQQRFNSTTSARNLKQTEMTKNLNIKMNKKMCMENDQFPRQCIPPPTIKTNENNQLNQNKFLSQNVYRESPMQNAFLSSKNKKMMTATTNKIQSNEAHNHHPQKFYNILSKLPPMRTTASARAQHKHKEQKQNQVVKKRMEKENFKEKQTLNSSVAVKKNNTTAVAKDSDENRTQNHYSQHDDPWMNEANNEKNFTLQGQTNLWSTSGSEKNVWGPSLFPPANTNKLYNSLHNNHNGNMMNETNNRTKEKNKFPSMFRMHGEYGHATLEGMNSHLDLEKGVKVHGEEERNKKNRYTKMENENEFSVLDIDRMLDNLLQEESVAGRMPYKELQSIEACI